MSNGRKLRRPAKRAAARALAAASQCQDCGAKATRPRRGRQPGAPRRDWVIDIPHEPTCPARLLTRLRDSLAVAAVERAQPSVEFPLRYVEGTGVVVAGE